MTLKTENGIIVPTPPDIFRPTAQLKDMADSTTVIVDVVNLTAANALTKRSGLAVRRLDLPGTPVHVWDMVLSVWVGPGAMNVQGLTFSPGYGARGAPYLAPALYVDGGTVFMEGTLTNTTTATIAANSTVILGTIPDTRLYPLGTTRQRVSITIGTTIPNTDGYVNVGTDGKVGVFLNNGVGTPAINSVQINLAGLTWRLK